jgi:IPT/TIG domain
MVIYMALTMDRTLVTVSARYQFSNSRPPFFVAICFVFRNSSNNGYVHSDTKKTGAMMTGCQEGMYKPDAKTQDRVHVLLGGKYYGHPNRIRAVVDNDPRQCVWKDPVIDPDVMHGKVTYQKPLVMMPSSTTGIIEYTADHFDRQLRHNLLVVKYTSSLSRIILRSDGLGVIPQSNPPLALGIGQQGLSITQAPDGTLIEIRYTNSSVFYHQAVENVTSTLKVFSAFPRRGPAKGGFVLNVFGRNLDTVTTVVIVNPRIGDMDCPIVSIISSNKLTCTMPQGDRGTTVHIRVSSNITTYHYLRGFRYINGTFEI